MCWFCILNHSNIWRGSRSLEGVNVGSAETRGEEALDGAPNKITALIVFLNS